MRTWRSDAAGAHSYASIGPALFRYGFVFSVGLTLLPIPLAILSWGIRALHALF